MFDGLVKIFDLLNELISGGDRELFFLLVFLGFHLFVDNYNKGI